MGYISLTTTIAIAWLCGRFVSNDGAPTYTYKTEFGNVIRDVLVTHKRGPPVGPPKFPSIQLPPPHMQDYRPEPHQQHTKHNCADLTTDSESSESMSSAPTKTNLLNKMTGHPRLTPPPINYPNLPRPNFPSSMFAFPKPPSDVSVSIGQHLPPITFSISAPPMFNIMDLLSQLATQLRTQDQATYVPVTLKEPTESCQGIDQLGPLTSHDVITIEIKDIKDQVLWNSECLPDDNLYILPGYKVSFHNGADDNQHSYYYSI